MGKYNELDYIRYCLRENKNLEIAKQKLLRLISEDTKNSGKLYALLANFTSNLDEKKEIYAKGLEVDPTSPQVYLGMFNCNLAEEEYEEAKNNLSQYRNFMQKKLPCNTCLIDILLDEVLGNEQSEYVADDYYFTTRLKDERYSVYCDILLALQNEEYEEAYTKLQYFGILSKDLNIEPISKLLNAVMIKKNSVFQKVKFNNKNV